MCIRDRIWLSESDNRCIFEEDYWMGLRINPGGKVYSKSVTNGIKSAAQRLSLIHISEPTRLGMISYAVFCLKKKKKQNKKKKKYNLKKKKKKLKTKQKHK